MTRANLDPRVHLANQKAAACCLADAAFRLECIEAQLRDLAHQPATIRTYALSLTLGLERFCAEREERRALCEARAAGLQDGQEYPARLGNGEPCTLFLDGPLVSVNFD